MWIWPPIIVAVIAIYMVAYILLRTSGDGRPALQRLAHPTKGGLQEEYGGDGTGRRHAGYASPERPASDTGANERSSS